VGRALNHRSVARLLPAEEVDPADLTLMQRVGVAMYGCGAAIALISAIAVQESLAGQRAHFVGAAIGLGFALLLMRSQRPRYYRLSVLISTAIVSGITAVAQPIGALHIFYLWPVLFSAYFLGRRWTAITLAWLAVSFAFALLGAAHTDAEGYVFVSVLLSVGLVGVVVTMMRERERRLAAGLQAAARTDALTGLLNRHGLGFELERLIGESRRTGVPLTFALFDLDHFKRFNDAHGHLCGDEALRAVGDVLRLAARAGDCVARFGGEEFAVVLRDATCDGGRAYADRVAVELADRVICGEPALRVSASCGIAGYGVCEDVDDVFSLADRALYAAKDAGRGRAAWWSGEVLHVGDALSAAARASRRHAANGPREYVPRIGDRALDDPTAAALHSRPRRRA
jgi:diguanylate cyclase (GGDEF)-like protein